MRLLLISDYFPPVAPGGAEWSVYYLSEALAKRGHAVGIVTLNHGPTPQPPAGVQVFSMPFPFRLLPGQNIHRQGILENSLFHLAFAFFIRRTALRFRADILHAQSKNALPASTLVSRLTGIPSAFTLRDIGISCPFGMCFINGSDVEKCSLSTCLGSCSNYLADHYASGRLWDKIKVKVRALLLWPDTRWKQQALNTCSVLIAPSHGLLKALPTHLRNKSWNVIPHLPPPSNGSAALETLPPGLPARFVLYLGKISPGKGIHVLEDAIEKVARDVHDAHFVVAGKGRWEPRVGSPVSAIGSVNHASAQKLMERAACVVVPSLVPEAYNRVVLEAMSLGKPVVVSDAGSLPEQVIHEKDGFVVPRGNADALALALTRLLKDPEMAARLGEEGKKSVHQQADPHDVLHRLTELYQKAANAPKSSRWTILNLPSRLILQAIVFFNDKAKRAAMWLVWLTGKSSRRVHPKNLMADDPSYAWYRNFLLKSDRVLDVGCGHGTHTMIAAETTREAIGMDYDPKNLATCEARAVEKKLSNVRFARGNAEERLPFNDREFDSVLLLDVLEHLNRRDGTLGEVHRVLKPGGRLLVAIPNRETSWKSRLKRAGLFYYSDRDHKIEYSLSEARYEIERNHFQIQEPVDPVVIDTPWVGTIDMIGGISLGLYRRLQAWKFRAARENPEESIGFQIVAHKI